MNEELLLPTGIAPGAAWRDLNRRFRVLWILLLACLPGSFLPAVLLGGPIPTGVGLVALGLLWGAAIAWAGWRVARFPCPRCGLAFFESWLFLKLLRDRCAHCDLPRSAASGTTR